MRMLLTMQTSLVKELSPRRKMLKDQRLMLKHHQTTLLRLNSYQDHMLLALMESLEMKMQLTMQNIIVKKLSPRRKMLKDLRVMQRII